MDQGTTRQELESIFQSKGYKFFKRKPTKGVLIDWINSNGGNVNPDPKKNIFEDLDTMAKNMGFKYFVGTISQANEKLNSINDLDQIRKNNFKFSPMINQNLMKGISDGIKAARVVFFDYKIPSQNDTLKIEENIPKEQKKISERNENLGKSESENVILGVGAREKNIIFDDEKKINDEKNIIFDDEKNINDEKNIIFDDEKNINDEKNIIFDENEDIGEIHVEQENIDDNDEILFSEEDENKEGEDILYEEEDYIEEFEDDEYDEDSQKEEVEDENILNEDVTESSEDLNEDIVVSADVIAGGEDLNENIVVSADVIMGGEDLNKNEDIVTDEDIDEDDEFLSEDDEFLSADDEDEKVEEEKEKEENGLKEKIEENCDKCLFWSTNIDLQTLSNILGQESNILFSYPDPANPKFTYGVNSNDGDVVLILDRKNLLKRFEPEIISPLFPNVNLLDNSNNSTTNEMISKYFILQQENFWNGNRKNQGRSKVAPTLCYKSEKWYKESGIWGTMDEPEKMVNKNDISLVGDDGQGIISWCNLEFIPRKDLITNQISAILLPAFTQNAKFPESDKFEIEKLKKKFGDGVEILLYGYDGSGNVLGPKDFYGFLGIPNVVKLGKASEWGKIVTSRIAQNKGIYSSLFGQGRSKGDAYAKYVVGDKGKAAKLTELMKQKLTWYPSPIVLSEASFDDLENKYKKFVSENQSVKITPIPSENQPIVETQSKMVVPKPLDNECINIGFIYAGNEDKMETRFALLGHEISKRYRTAERMFSTYEKIKKDMCHLILYATYSQTPNVYSLPSEYISNFNTLAALSNYSVIPINFVTATKKTNYNPQFTLRDDEKQYNPLCGILLNLPNERQEGILLKYGVRYDNLGLVESSQNEFNLEKLYTVLDDLISHYSISDWETEKSKKKRKE